MIHRKLAVKLLCIAVMLIALAAAASADGIKITGPVSGAIVRETVKFYIDPADMPSDGYVSINIDKAFKTAHILSTTNTDPVFVWDTKEAYTTPDQPDTKQYVQDGSHTIDISIFGTGSKLIGTDSVTVNVANKINVPAAQGVNLAYQWHENEVLKYSRQSKLNDLTNGVNNTLQASSVQFIRSVEDIDSEGALIRDKVLPAGNIINSGISNPVDAIYVLKSDYRTVSSHGDVIDVMPPLTPGDHFGFSLPVLPARRVSIGDSWESPVSISLQWNNEPSAPITAEGRLEDFEWQDRYPTARFRETYNGPVSFPSQSGIPVTFTTVKFERVVYFAYNSGRLIKTVTTMSVEGDLTPEQLTDLGFTGIGQVLTQTNQYGQPGGGYPGGAYPGVGYPGAQPGMGVDPETGRPIYGNPGAGGAPGSYPGGAPTGYPGAPTGYPGAPTGYPGAPGSYPGGAPTGAPGGYPGAPGGYPGAQGGRFPGAPGGYPGAPGGYPGAAGGYPGAPRGYPGAPGGYPGGGPGGANGVATTTSVKLDLSEDTDILTGQ